MSEAKKNPFVMQDGNKIPINMANAYRMQYRALLEVLGVGSLDDLSKATDEQRVGIPMYPAYDEVCSSPSRVNAAMAMMRAITDSVIADKVEKIYEKLDAISSFQTAVDKLTDGIAKLDGISAKIDSLASRDDIAEVVNAEVTSRVIDPNDMAAFMNSVHEFIARHGEFVQAFSAFIQSIDRSNESADKNNADVLAAVHEVKGMVGRVDEMANMLIGKVSMNNIDNHAKDEAPAPVSELREAPDSGAYAPVFNINIHGDNHGALNLGAASGCSTFGSDSQNDDDDDDSWDDDFLGGRCEDCDFDCDDDDDDYPETDDDVNEDETPVRRMDGMTSNSGRKYFFGDNEELDTLKLLNHGSPIPVGVLNDIRAFAYCIYHEYFMKGAHPTSEDGFTLFVMDKLMRKVNLYYNHSAMLMYIRDLSGNTVENFFRIVRNEIVRLLVADSYLGYSEMEEFIWTELVHSYSMLIDSFVEHDRSDGHLLNNDDAHNLIRAQLTTLCEKLEDDIPDLMSFLSAADGRVRRLWYDNHMMDEYVLEELLSETDFIDAVYAYRDQSYSGPTSEDEAIRHIEDNLFMTPMLVSDNQAFSDARNRYFVENLLLRGVDGCTEVYRKVKESAMAELRVAMQDDQMNQVYGRIMDDVNSVRGYNHIIRPGVTKAYIVRLEEAVKDAFHDVMHENGYEQVGDVTDEAPKEGV